MSNYHGKVMNVPIKYNKAASKHAYYKVGHRDARHDAAEITAEADAEIDRLRARVAELEAVLRKIESAEEATTWGHIAAIRMASAALEGRDDE